MQIFFFTAILPQALPPLGVAKADTVFPIVVARVAHASGQAVGVINSARIGAAFAGPIIATTVLSWTSPAGLYLVLALIGLACLPLARIRVSRRGRLS